MNFLRFWTVCTVMLSLLLDFRDMGIQQLWHLQPIVSRMNGFEVNKREHLVLLWADMSFSAGVLYS